MNNIKVLRIEDLPHILKFEKENPRQKFEDPVDEELFSWHAPWRQESLEHYLPLGWSYGIWDGEEGESNLLAYFIAQPMLFVNSMTQSLWLEHINFKSQALGVELFDLMYKLSREKHFQKLKFQEKTVSGLDLSNWKTLPAEDKIVEVNTAKLR